jgi:hypothetical protein
MAISESTVSGWINVKERLPDNRGPFEVKTRYGDIEKCFFHQDIGGFALEYFHPKYWTHWWRYTKATPVFDVVEWRTPKPKLKDKTNENTDS